MNDIKQCVYKYVCDDHIIYIGKTNASLKQRIYGHSKEDKFRDYLDESKIYYAELKNNTETSFVELYLINKYKPILNVASVLDGDSNIFMEEPTWKSWEKFVDENEYVSKPKQENKPSKLSKQFFSVEEIIEYGLKIVEQYRNETTGLSNGWFFTLGDDGTIEEITAAMSNGKHRAFKENAYDKIVTADELIHKYKNNLFVPNALVNREGAKKPIHDYALIAEVSRVLGYELDLKEANIETIGVRQ